MADGNQDQPRDGGGRFATNPATADRDAQAARLRRDGHSYRHIAAQLGIDVHSAHDAVRRAMQAVRREAADELVTLELERLTADLERLNRLRDTAAATLEIRRAALEGDPDADPAPTLAIIDRLVKIDDAKRKNSESRRRLLGLDQPVRVSATVTDALMAEINDLADQMGALDEQDRIQAAARDRG